MDRAIEQHVLLQDDANMAAQPGGIGLGNVLPVEEDLTAVRKIETLDQFGEGRFA
ncbi:hypothetical protein D3C87_2089740 [compost metagenome]